MGEGVTWGVAGVLDQVSFVYDGPGGWGGGILPGLLSGSYGMLGCLLNTDCFISRPNGPIFSSHYESFGRRYRKVPSLILGSKMTPS